MTMMCHTRLIARECRGIDWSNRPRLAEGEYLIHSQGYYGNGKYDVTTSK